MTEIRKCLRDFFPYLRISALVQISTWQTENGTKYVNFVQTVFREQDYFGSTAKGGARCWRLHHQKGINVLRVQFSSWLVFPTWAIVISAATHFA